MLDLADGGARVLLGGHLDTVPAQGNRPGRRDGERVIGLGASDMKGALAVMIELVRDGLPFGALFFGREELPFDESALTPLLARHPLSPELAVMMEPTDNALHAGCLGNVNATWTFRGVSGHSARPWFADNAITRAAAGVTALAAHDPEPHDFDGLEFVEVASVTKIAGGIAMNVIPGEATAHVNYRYAPGRTPEEAEARLHELCAGHGELRIDAHAPSGAVARGPLVDALIAAGDLAVAPKQAWTPVAEFAQAGLAGGQLRPRRPAAGAHARRVDLGGGARAQLPRARDFRGGGAVKPSPILTGLKTYPFVRLPTPSAELLARGRRGRRLRHRRAARGHRRRSSARRWRPR